MFSFIAAMLSDCEGASCVLLDVNDNFSSLFSFCKLRHGPYLAFRYQDTLYLLHVCQLQRISTQLTQQHLLDTTRVTIITFTLHSNKNANIHINFQVQMNSSLQRSRSTPSSPP